MNKIINTTLPQQLEILSNNLGVFIENHPKLYLASEEVNNIFDYVYTEQIKINNGEDWEYASAQMLFGAYSSWMYSFLLTSSGLNDLGLMVIRRAIEFCCYISKIVNNNQYTKIWIERFGSREPQKRFNGKFSLPTSYFSNKYKDLHPLLVWYEYASEFGTHANYSTLVSKWAREKANKIAMSFHDLGNKRYISAGASIKIGSLIIVSIINSLKEKNISNYDNLMLKINDMKKIIKDAAIEATKLEYNDNIPKELIDSINNENTSELEARFEELKKQYAQ